MKKKSVALIAVIIAIIVAAFAWSASATPGEDHKEWVCHPVEGQGETGTGWNLIEPDKASSHIDENGQGKHTRKDGRTDVYAAADGTCPGEETPPPSCPEGKTDYNGTEPGCGTPPEECPNGDLNGDKPGCADNEEPETPTPPKPETPEEKPEKPVVKPDRTAKPRGDQGVGDRPVARPVEVPTAVAAGK